LIQIDISKCTGCRRCEVVCAFFHTGRINHHLSRIKVLNLYETGIDGPVVCQQCQERYCLKCSVQALSIGPRGEIKVSPTVCTLCGSCVQRCPIGAMEIFNEIVHVCDLCGGDPKCVQACTEGAIVWNPKNKKRPSLSSEKKETKGMAPQKKRLSYLLKQGEQLRKEWRRAHA